MPTVGSAVRCSVCSARNRGVACRCTVGGENSVRETMCLGIPIVVKFGIGNFCLNTKTGTNLDLCNETGSSMSCAASTACSHFVSSFVGVPGRCCAGCDGSNIRGVGFRPVISIVNRIKCRIIDFSAKGRSSSGPVVFHVNTCTRCNLFGVIGSSNSNPLFRVSRASPSRMALCPCFAAMSARKRGSVPLSIKIGTAFVFRLPLPRGYRYLRARQKTS